MIVTLTTNPSLDRTVSLGSPLVPGAVQPARGVREDAAGKGINVARVIQAAGHSTIAVLPLDESDPFASTLRGDRLPLRTIRARGVVRTNLTLTDPTGVTTKINLPGITLDEAEADALCAAVVDTCAGADWLVLAGSLAPGLPDDYYVRVTEAVRTRWGQAAPLIAVDTSGPALRAVVGDGRPDLIKPNEEELADLVGEDLSTVGDLVETVRALAGRIVPHDVGAAFVTLGGDGAVLVTTDGAWHARPPVTRVRSTVGAGDSSLAGFLLAHVAGRPPGECLASGIRYGSAAAALAGTQPPTAADLTTEPISVIRWQ